MSRSGFVAVSLLLFAVLMVALTSMCWRGMAQCRLGLVAHAARLAALQYGMVVLRHSRLVIQPQVSVLKKRCQQGPILIPLAPFREVMASIEQHSITITHCWEHEGRVYAGGYQLDTESKQPICRAVHFGVVPSAGRMA